MEEELYTLKCPYCNKEYGMKLTKESAHTYYLIGEHKNIGLKCSCGEKIIYNKTNLSPNHK